MAGKTSRTSAKGRKEGRRQAGRCEAGAPRRRQTLGSRRPTADAPVQAYIAAMPGWQRNVGHRLDALIVRTVPGRAPRRSNGNSPLVRTRRAGLVPRRPLLHEVRQGGILPRHVAASSPSRRGQGARTRATLDIHEDDQLDDAQVRRLGEASEPFARRTNVSGESAEEGRQQHEESDNNHEEED